MEGIYLRKLFVVIALEGFNIKPDDLGIKREKITHNLISNLFVR